MSTQYTAILGTTAKILTIVVSILFAGVVAFFAYLAFVTDEIVVSVIFTCVILGIVAVYCLVYLYRPIGYMVGAERVTIRRPIKDVHIPLAEIKDAFVVKRELMQGIVREGGNGGVYGFYGNFRNHFGRMAWYATRKNNYVMLETTNGRIVLTPDHTDMVKEIRRRLHQEY